MQVSTVPIEFFESTISSNPSGSQLGSDIQVRRLIFEAYRKDSGITNFYKELFRNLRTIFSQFNVRDNEGKLSEVKCIVGTPERSIGKQKQQDNIILPLFALTQELTEAANDQRHYNPTYSTETYWDDIKLRAVRVISFVPKPVKVEYELSIWAKYQEDLDQLTEQVHRLFNPSVEVNLPFTRFGQIYLDREYNETERSLPDQTDRNLIRSFRIIVETHIPAPKFLMTSTGQIERFNIDAQILEETREIP